MTTTPTNLPAATREHIPTWKLANEIRSRIAPYGGTALPSTEELYDLISRHFGLTDQPAVDEGLPMVGGLKWQLVHFISSGRWSWVSAGAGTWFLHGDGIGANQTWDLGHDTREAAEHFIRDCAIKEQAAKRAAGERRSCQECGSFAICGDFDEDCGKFFVCNNCDHKWSEQQPAATRGKAVDPVTPYPSKDSPPAVSVVVNPRSRILNWPAVSQSQSQGRITASQVCGHNNWGHAEVERKETCQTCGAVRRTTISQPASEVKP